MLFLCKIRWGLAVGDVIALTAFAWIGRGSHGSSALDFEVIKTALPFYAGSSFVSLTAHYDIYIVCSYKL
jgi:Protein of unknown function (DUF3054)